MKRAYDSHIWFGVLAHLLEQDTNKTDAEALAN